MVFTLQGRTREQIRVAIGDNLGAVFVGTATGGGDTTSLLDTALRGSNDEFNGRYVRLTSGTNDGENFRVDDYVASTSDITLVPAATASISSGDTYELWEEPYDPKVIDRFIQAAIVAASDRVYDPEEDISLFADKNTARFDIPSKFAMLTDVYRRSGVTARTIHSCSRDFDETNDAQMVDSLDTQDKKTGTASLKIATTAGNGSFISDSFTATTAADTWTYFRVALANPESDTAIASIGLEYNANSGTNTVWFDDIKATVSGTEVWERIPSHLWKIDAQARDLIFTDGGRSFAGNSLLKLVGGDKPAVIAADSTSNEIDDEYVIADATSRALMGYSGGSFTDAEERRNLAAFWRGHAEKRWRAMPMLVNVRKVS